MSAELSGSIRPVSARYAAQIKELLTYQVRERIAEVEQASARKGVESGRADQVNPVRDAAEGSASPFMTLRETFRFGASGATPAQPDTGASPPAEPAPPGAFLDLKV